MNDNNPDPTKDMSPFGAALFNCMRNPDPMKQIEALSALSDRIEAGEFLTNTKLMKE